jgi:hypothetical protein
MNKGGVTLTSMDEAWRFCEAIARTDVVPKSMRGKPAEVFAVIQAGAELGVSPLRALANMKIINGRVGPMGSLAKAKVREANVLAKGTGFKEWFEGTEGQDDWTACFQTKRGDEIPVTTKFSVKDAKRAQLWGKVGKFGPSPWVTYPQRMLMWRAVGFHMDDYYSDILMGFHIAEVLDDYPEELVQSAVMEPVKEPMKDPLLDELASTAAEMQPPPPVSTCVGMGGDPETDPSAAELAEDMADLVPEGVDPQTGEYLDEDTTEQAPTSKSPLEEIMAEKAAEVPPMSEEEAMADLIREGVLKEEDLAPADPDNKQEEGGEYKLS